jgi:FKBP-type peptidyl-prolyl cis-trans isomerase FkpA/FKBP-type peptidyl-prolyl cis-trans isomerase FklB
MKMVAKIVLGLVALQVVTACNKGAKIESDQQKVSYIIGQQIGRDMKSRSVEIDVDALSTGLKEALAGKENRFKPEEIQAVMSKFQEAMMKKVMAAAEQSKKAGDDYLAKNKTKSGVKVTSTGLQYEVVAEGKGKSPKKDDKVQVHYTGTLIDGTKFDSSKDHGGAPAEIPVSGVIPGWTEALLLMKEGGKMKLTIPSDLAYGPSGNPPRIPPHSVLLFEVELVKVL